MKQNPYSQHPRYLRHLSHSYSTFFPRKTFSAHLNFANHFLISLVEIYLHDSYGGPFVHLGGSYLGYFYGICSGYKWLLLERVDPVNAERNDSLLNSIHKKKFFISL